MSSTYGEGSGLAVRGAVLTALSVCFVIAVAAQADAGDAWLERTIERPQAASADPPEGENSGGPVAEERQPGALEAILLWWPAFVVLGLIAVAAFAARRWLPGAAAVGGGGPMEVLARKFVANKQSLCLVRLGKRVVLLGVTADRMATLAEISDPDEAAAVVAAAVRERPGSFTSAFAALAKKETDGLTGDLHHNRNRSKAAVGEPEDGPVPAARLPQAAAEVRNLVRRIRAISSNVDLSMAPGASPGGVSAEPTR